MRIHRVIKFGVEPIGCGMTSAAVVRQPQLHMRRVLAVRKISSVASEARSRCAFEHVVHVAGRARQRGVRARQGVAGHL